MRGPALCSLPILEPSRRVPLAQGGPRLLGLRLVSASGPQRWNPVGGFCETLLPSDRWPWSDVSGLQHRPLDGVALPSPHWEWESDWYVDENFGGEPTEKGVGELGSCRGSPPRGGSALGSACPPRAVPSTPWRQPPARAPRAPRCLSLLLAPTPPHPAPSTPALLLLPGAPSRAPCPHPILTFQGWTYAIDFPATYTRDKKWNSCVRRRRWIRYRRYKSRDTWAQVREPVCGLGGGGDCSHRDPHPHPPHGHRGPPASPGPGLCCAPVQAMPVPRFGGCCSGS